MDRLGRGSITDISLSLGSGALQDPCEVGTVFEAVPGSPMPCTKPGRGDTGSICEQMSGWGVSEGRDAPLRGRVYGCQPP